MSWRKIWGPHSVDQDQAMNASLVKHWISGRIFLTELLGDYPCGLVVLEAYFRTKDGEVTAEYIEHRLVGQLSEDTARRKLNAMVEAGKVTVRKTGRTLLYRLDPKTAEAAIAYLRGEPIVLPASKPQIAVNS
jgi:DNA-binding transcriptional ArsR family regulator